MSDINIGNWSGVFIVALLGFIFGFTTGCYSSFRLINFKFHQVFRILFSSIIGVITGFLSVFILLNIIMSFARHNIFLGDLYLS
jgi:hypothetical protein